MSLNQLVHRALHYIEQLGLLLILIATIVAVGQLLEIGLTIMILTIAVLVVRYGHAKLPYPLVENKGTDTKT